MPTYNLASVEREYINGVHKNSPMYQSSTNSITRRTARAMMQKGAVNDNQQGRTSGNLLQGGAITGVSLNIGQYFSVDSSGNITATSGTLGGWSFSPSVISSVNGNILWNAVENNLVMTNAGLPQVVIQG